MTYEHLLPNICAKCGTKIGRRDEATAIPDYENGVWYCENCWNNKKQSEKVRQSWEIRRANQALRDSMYD